MIEAGRELDLLIAMKIFGWNWHTRLGYEWLGPPEEVGSRDDLGTIRLTSDLGGEVIREEPFWMDETGDHGIVPHYSTNMGDAWEIVEWFVKDGSCPGLLFDDNGHWALSLSGSQSVPLGEESEDIATSFFIEKALWQDTPEMAICYAALQAVEE